MTVVKLENPLGYRCPFISIVGYYVSRLDPSISKFRHVKMQALITDHLISKSWGLIYSDRLDYDIPWDKGDESDPINF